MQCRLQHTEIKMLCRLLPISSLLTMQAHRAAAPPSRGLRLHPRGSCVAPLPPCIAQLMIRTAALVFVYSRPTPTPARPRKPHNPHAITCSPKSSCKHHAVYYTLIIENTPPVHPADPSCHASALYKAASWHCKARRSQKRAASANNAAPNTKLQRQHTARCTVAHARAYVQRGQRQPSGG